MQVSTFSSVPINRFQINIECLSVFIIIVLQTEIDLSHSRITQPQT